MLRYFGRAAAAATLLLGALPLLLTRPAPLQDWPNHIARIHILVDLLHGSPFWGHYYRLTGFFVPNAALDLGITGLRLAGLPLPLAAQCFLVATYALFVASFLALARAYDASNPAKPCFAVLLFYGNALFWGLVNYVLGLGLLLGLLALWLRAGPRTRLAVAAAGAALLLLAHLVVAVLWIIVLGCHDLHRLRRARLAHCLSWLIALLVVASLLSAMPHGGGLGIGYAGGRFGIAGHKLWLFAKVLLGGSLLQDLTSLAGLLVCIIAVFAGRPSLAPAPALAAAILVLTVLLAPERIGDGSQLDSRLAIAPLLLLAAAVRIRPHPVARIAIPAAVLARTLVLAWAWHASGQEFAQYRGQTASLPSGSLMLMAYGTRLSTLSWQHIWSPPITSIATQLVLHDLFVPTIFAEPGQQPVALDARYTPLKQPWNLSDPVHFRASARALAALCASGAFPHIYLTVLYPGDVAGMAGAALLRPRHDFLLLDACRLPNPQPP
ncbi:hypothetical protein [Lichenicoccus sp.]|uniref:hypothetical protein n=1 Tax=Lichenicoccus sp. TaxID=2781899 RepID=UPI003D13A45D